MSETEIRIAWSTAPDRDTALRIARALVGDGLAACVNIVPGLLSVYRWQGEVQEDGEVLLIAKTRADQVAACGERLRELHPYDVPEFVVVAAVGGAASYLDWVAAECAP